MSSVSSTGRAGQASGSWPNVSLSVPTHVEARPGIKRNVSEDERLISLIAGGALAGIGLGTRGLTGMGLVALGGGLLWRAASGHCALYQKMGLSSLRDERGVRAGHGVQVAVTMHLVKSPEEVSKAWGKLTELPKIMRHLERVEELDGNRTHWVAETMGMTFEWDAETTSFIKGKEIRFRSLPGGDIDTEGVVLFENDPQGGTILRVSLSYDPPAGQYGDQLARLFGADMQSQIKEDLRRFKQKLETGEVASVAGQPHG